MPIHTMKNGTMEYLVADGIAVPHAFTTRLGGVSEGYLASLNLGMNRGDKNENVEKNYAILEETIGFDANKLVLANQVHGDDVRVVTAADCRGLDHRAYPECDGLITNTPGVSLVVFTADCTPILLHDPVTGAVGAVHAGWRGTALDIAGKAVAKMVAEFGCLPQNIRAAIGPNIGPCCFQTDGDVPRAMVQAFGPEAEAYIRAAGNKYYVNLKNMNALALRRAGVENIEISEECTMCNPDKYWSHRYTQGLRGSQGAVICCKGGIG
jgi:YfiH family protein